MMDEFKFAGLKGISAKIFLSIVIGIVIALFIVLATCNPTAAQTVDTIPKYQVEIKQYRISNGVRLYWYHAVGSDDGQDLTFNTAGGGGISYNKKDCDSVCIYSASCGYDQFQATYTLNSIGEVLFNTESCLERNANDIKKSIEYVNANPEKFNNPNLQNINLRGLSWGGGVMNYLAYHNIDIDKVISYWGFVLDINDITEVKTLVVAGTRDKTIPFDEGSAYGVYVYGAKAVYDYMIQHHYDCELMRFEGAGHGLKQGELTSANKKLANNRSIKFLYE